MLLKILKNLNGISFLPILLIILSLSLIGGGIYWYMDDKTEESLVVTENDISKKNINEEESIQEELANEEKIEDIDDMSDGVIENEEVKIYISPSEACLRMGGFLDEGLCKKNNTNCIDYDAYLGENSKYLPSSIESNNESITQGEKIELRDSCKREEDKYILKEAVCSSNIETVDDFNNSFVEYECENGCSSSKQSCKKDKYTINGEQLLLSYFMHQTKIISESKRIAFSGDGLTTYTDLNVNTNTIISEEDFKKLYNTIEALEEYFVHFDNYNPDFDFEDELLKPSKYFDPNKEEGYRIDINYTDGENANEEYAPEGIRKSKAFICNINCPKEIAIIENLLDSFKPDEVPSENNVVPSYSYNGYSCSETGNDYACWYNIIATSFPDYTYQEARDNILFTEIDYKLDTDSDGINDFNEKYLGTDIYNKDSDGDGYDDLSEIKNGYNPIGDNKIDARMEYYVEEVIDGEKYWTAYESTVKEYENKIINQCKNIGGEYYSLDKRNFNCFGSYEKDDCLSLFGCYWSDYDYCKPMNSYCECSDGDKYFLNLNKSFDGICK